MGLRRSRLLRALVAIALVSLAAVGLRLSEGDEDANFEIVRGVAGEALVLNEATVKVTEVRVGTALSKDDEVIASTPGLFVVVRVAIASTGSDPIVAFTPKVVTRTRRYDEFGSSLTYGLAPGFASEEDLVFEVDPAAIADLTLDLDPGQVIVAYPEHARIHLGITPANAEAWRTAGRDQVLPSHERTVRGA